MALKIILWVHESVRDSSSRVSFVRTLINKTHFCFHFGNWLAFLFSSFSQGQPSSTCCGLSGQGQMGQDLRVRCAWHSSRCRGWNREQRWTPVPKELQFSRKENPTPSILVLIMIRKKRYTPVELNFSNMAFGARKPFVVGGCAVHYRIVYQHPWPVPTRGHLCPPR